MAYTLDSGTWGPGLELRSDQLSHYLMFCFTPYG